MAALSRTRQALLAFARPTLLSTAKVFANLSVIAAITGNKVPAAFESPLYTVAP